MNDDLHSLIGELKSMNKRLSDGYMEMWKQAKVYSAAERDYKIALHHRILELKTEGYAITLILELAKGTEKIADLRFQRDLAERKYETTKESIRSLRAMASVYQSVLKVQNEI